MKSYACRQWTEGGFATRQPEEEPDFKRVGLIRQPEEIRTKENSKENDKPYLTFSTFLSLIQSVISVKDMKR